MVHDAFQAPAVASKGHRVGERPPRPRQLSRGVPAKKQHCLDVLDLGAVTWLRLVGGLERQCADPAPRCGPVDFE